MTARKAAQEALPRSHVFITLAFGRRARTFAPRSGLALALAVIAPLLVLWFIGSTFFLVFHDDLVTTLLLRERDMQYGYEDRIASLRNQLDRESTRQLVTQRSVETKLDELTQRATELQTRSGVIDRLASTVMRLDGTPPAREVPRASTPIGFAPPMAAGVPTISGELSTQEPAVVQKPHPEAMIGSAPALGVARSQADRMPERISLLSSGLDAVEGAQTEEMAHLDGRVRRTVTQLHNALASAGLSESRFAAQEGGSGGPFVPLTPQDDASPFARAATGIQLTLSQAEQLRAAVRHVPFSRPLSGDPEITSPFGPRVDPFLGRAAMHTGIDLSEGMGAEVRATAPGRITVAGQANGYGTMVEIDHGAGLSTRYAHLSETDVAVGQVVKLGEVVGRVGATGRATGPHLHYETRIDGEAVDPLRFMAAGQRLQTAMAERP